MRVAQPWFNISIIVTAAFQKPEKKKINQMIAVDDVLKHTSCLVLSLILVHLVRPLRCFFFHREDRIQVVKKALRKY